MTASLVENSILRFRRWSGVEGPLVLPEGLWENFLAAPSDICPEFEGPPGYKWKDARGKDHPRYGRFVYAFAKTTRPELIVEVGTDTGGTAVGWARALIENKRGRLVCIDSDAYAQSTYPRAVEHNLAKLKAASAPVELRRGDSRAVIPELAEKLAGRVDIYLVDGDHTYEGARADLYNGLKMLKAGGFILVHDIDRYRKMNEATAEHPQPVYEAFMELAHQYGFEWCILKFIRKHLGIIRVEGGIRERAVA
jgi:predicted O-methyltransferase YrrM